MAQHHEPEILEQMMQLAHCNYISDLHAAMFAPQVAAAVRQLDLAAYSLEDWRYAVTYITNDPCSASSAEQAAAQLLAWLEAK